MKKKVLSLLAVVVIALAVMPFISGRGASVVYAVPMVEITFDSNNGTGESYTLNVTSGQSFEVPDCSFSTPNGYCFSGWNTAAEYSQGNSGTWYDPGDSI